MRMVGLTSNLLMANSSRKSLQSKSDFQREVSSSGESTDENIDNEFRDLVKSHDSLTGLNKLITAHKKSNIESFEIKQKMLAAVDKAQKVQSWKTMVVERIGVARQNLLNSLNDIVNDIKTICAELMRAKQTKKKDAAVDVTEMLVNVEKLRTKMDQFGGNLSTTLKQVGQFKTE